MKRQLHQSTHPFDLYPFEVYWCELWQPVERLRIRDGTIRMHIIDNEAVTEVEIPMSSLRITPRKATASDCTCFLRPGVDVYVLTKPQKTEDREDSSDEELEPVWRDAKISSIERKPHEVECSCQFYVKSYVTQGPIGMIKKALSKEITTVQIDKISIFQKLERNPCEDKHYRWSFSEDSLSRHMFKLFTGKFASDLTWLLVTSVSKQLVFDVSSIHSQIVYQIWDSDGSTYSQNSDKCSKAVTFKLEDGNSVPIIVPFIPTDFLKAIPGSEVDESGTLSLYDQMELRRSKRRNVQPDRYMGCDDMPDPDIDVFRTGLFKTSKLDYEDMPLALSVQDDHAHKTDTHKEINKVISSFRKEVLESLRDSQRKIKLTEKKSLSSDEEEHRQDIADQGDHPSQSAIVPLFTKNDRAVHEVYPLATEVPEVDTGEISKTVSKYYAYKSSKDDGKRTSRSNYYSRMEALRKKKPGLTYSMGHSKWDWKAAYTKYPRMRKMRQRTVATDWQNIYNDGRPTSSRRSFSAGVYRELIRRCMTNIDSVVNQEQPEIIHQWKEFQSAKSLNQKDREKTTDNEKNREEEVEESEDESEEEISELDMLWKELDMALASAYLLDDNEETMDGVSNEMHKQNVNGRQVCQHDYRLNEEIGIICRLCGFVCTEIRYVSLPFFPSPCWTTNKHVGKEEEKDDSESKNEEKKEFENLSVPTHSDKPFSEEEENVWALIPNLREKLRFHQKRAFEFLWENLAGSTIPALMESNREKRGGCVISHSPGAGKTLLIIAFLQSYLKLFPGSRPLVLAPKTTLYTWYKEIIKWDIPIPVYQIHGGQTYRGEMLRQKIKLPPGLPRNQDVLHVLDCLEKIQMWLSHPSVLIMGYTSFLTLTRDDSSYTHRQYMAQVLRRCPGILILDEGHNPRSTKSRLRKGLMKVETGLRVLLSGTLFQNNFGEYFNTLCLARPRFVDEVLDELDPKYRKKDAKTPFSLENRARKVFINEISGKIHSDIGGDRIEGLNVLKNLTSGFIDVYEGGNSDSLPGLQIYTLMMKSTQIQQDILVKLQNERPIYKGFPLELELLITLGSIHPWLIRTTACASMYFDPDELFALERLKFDLKLGSKVKFVLSLIPRCLLRKEKVLIFCHNIAPINLFLEIFERFYGWRKGEEVLVLQGDLELFERGRVMDKFEEPGGPSRVMLASISACCEGISLTAASRVILLDSEWNPSKSKQAIARAFRPGQDKVVYVYQLLATGTLEEEKYKRTTWKEWVSSMIFSEELVEDPSQWQAPKIEDELLRELVEEDRGSLFHMIMKNEKASNGLMKVRD